MTQPAAIIGAGLAGLVAGYSFPGVPILEANPRGAAPHRALLRFRTDAVSRLTGIPFRKVRVHKGIWSEGAFRAPDVRLANLYARKCLDRVVGDRSIWSVDPVDRWVAPESLIEQMTQAMSERICFGVGYDFTDSNPSQPVISTAPMSHALDALRGLAVTERPTLARAPIWTRRYRVPLADAHQTVYFPDHSLSTYRASITGDLLILEMRNDLEDAEAAEELDAVCAAMGIDNDIDPVDANEQRYGKIIPLGDDERRGWLSRLTIVAGIYSLGRFATWRNVLLDDVVLDAEVIRRMLRSSASTNFHALRASAGR